MKVSGFSQRLLKFSVAPKNLKVGLRWEISILSFNYVAFAAGISYIAENTCKFMQPR